MLPVRTVGRSVFWVLWTMLALSVKATFTNPPTLGADLLVRLSIGQTVQIAWESPEPRIGLFVRHWDINTGVILGILLSNVPNTNTYNWVVGLNDGINSSAIAASPNFCLGLVDEDFKIQFFSRGFVIKDPIPAQVLTTTTRASSSTIFSTTSSTISSATSSAKSSTTSSAISVADTNQSAASGLSQSEKTGIGVGVALGGVALIVFAVLSTILLMRRRQQRQKGGQPASELPIDDENDPHKQYYTSSSQQYSSNSDFAPSYQQASYQAELMVDNGGRGHMPYELPDQGIPELGHHR
ncbi:hypothetical protein B0H63DRAFT_125589 [Podospora didyma]|uniref:Mid2 domain-containing protein n=1 Tax=Podospora didyma TaxID=330526 RepID=A0AAE0P069_9PEZI|nr:hypothetical protein B0H63DRAFT_125589 [Podospora didyma]